MIEVGTGHAFIHIGTHKTGSTAIQSFCSQNAAILRKAGFFYPTTHLKWAGHHPLAWSLGTRHPEADDVDTATIGRDILAGWEASGCPSLILSSEDFEFVPRPEVLQEALGIESASIVPYLRRQDRYLISEYNQHLRMYAKRFSGQIDEFYAAYNFIPRFDYTRLLGKWGRAFGAEALHPRSYDLVLADGRSIVADFVEALGMAWDDAFVLPDRASSNVSLDPYATAILRSLNEVAATPETHAQWVRLLNKASEVGHFVEAFGERTAQLPPDLQATLTEEFSSTNAQVISNHPQLAGGLDLTWSPANDSENFPSDVELLRAGWAFLASDRQSP